MVRRSQPFSGTRTGILMVLVVGTLSGLAALAALALAHGGLTSGRSRVHHLAMRRRTTVVRPLTIGFPAATGYSSASWPGGCVRGPGACGTVRYARGLRVTVAIRQLGTNRYWNGRAFAARRAQYRKARLYVRRARRRLQRQATWYYRLALPARFGGYRLSVRSTRLRHHRARRLAQRVVTFTVTSSPASASGPPTSPTPFTIAGDAAGALTPGGPAQSLGLRLTNPGASTIYVTSVHTALEAAGLPSGCSASEFNVAQAVLPAAGLPVPAHGTVALAGSQVVTPSIQMLDTGVDQGACAGAHLTLSYTGSAHS